MTTIYPLYTAATLMWLVLMALPLQAGPSFTIDVEGGAAFNGYNDVRIPGNTGSDISLTDDLATDETAFWRVRGVVGLGDRHELLVLVAPLTLNASGSVARDLDYNGVTFAAGEALDARYRFDSYRLTYRYALVRSDRISFDLGITAKVRDAAIRIKSESKSSEKTNTGFVPLINFALDWSFAPDMGLLLEGDALAAPQGRAEDILAALYTSLSEQLRLRAGYRILEGGADNDEVYSFALVHYLSVGVSWQF